MFDDESDDAYRRLQGFLPGAVAEALDYDTLRRLIQGSVVIPRKGSTCRHCGCLLAG